MWLLMNCCKVRQLCTRSRWSARSRAGHQQSLCLAMDQQLTGIMSQHCLNLCWQCAHGDTCRYTHRCTQIDELHVDCISHSNWEYHQQKYMCSHANTSVTYRALSDVRQGWLSSFCAHSATTPGNFLLPRTICCTFSCDCLRFKLDQTVDTLHCQLTCWPYWTLTQTQAC